MLWSMREIYGTYGLTAVLRSIEILTLPMLENIQINENATQINDVTNEQNLLFNNRNFGYTRSPYYGILQAKGDAVILCLLTSKTLLS